MRKVYDYEMVTMTLLCVVNSIYLFTLSVIFNYGMSGGLELGFLIATTVVFVALSIMVVNASLEFYGSLEKYRRVVIITAIGFSIGLLILLLKGY